MSLRNKSESWWELVGFWKSMPESVPLQTRERISLNVLNSYDMLSFELNIMYNLLFILFIYNQNLSSLEGRDFTIYVPIPLQLLQIKSYLGSYISPKWSMVWSCYWKSNRYNVFERNADDYDKNVKCLYSLKGIFLKRNTCTIFIAQ